ncbi:MAG: hypothetical protein KAV87_36065, partial [Desulfobacteraceae bacterium]|nr:hypothetical protein [Desulfobacteraceae bacterium]
LACCTPYKDYFLFTLLPRLSLRTRKASVAISPLIFRFTHPACPERSRRTDNRSPFDVVFCSIEA